MRALCQRLAGRAGPGRHYSKIRRIDCRRLPPPSGTGLQVGDATVTGLRALNVIFDVYKLKLQPKLEARCRQLHRSRRVQPAAAPGPVCTSEPEPGQGRPSRHLVAASVSFSEDIAMEQE